ncbi:glutamyl aminopeptidase-like [Anopheles cruzii]|uniref:glutamyl aminopeptidase-like n=1 Tax=Anopheles cruzii TaxID=68878 RepID=UPI0022EC7D51|nr:glutamyl aminopeptidase-like [Anopheles cruzii]
MWWIVLSLCLVPVWAGSWDRLPNSTVPLHYDLFLEASGLGGKDFSYRGKVSIRIAIVSDTDRVVLHSVGNSIDEIVLQTTTDGEVIPHQLEPNRAGSEFLHIRSHRPLSSLQDAEVLLTIAFRGQLGREKKGFYRTEYRGAKRVPVTVAATHFQPCYARRAFPCFDEPALKATFQLTIVSNSSHLVASNTPIAKVSPLSGGGKLVQFERTAPMQTYLVAFLVTNYAAIHTTSPSGVQVGVLAPPKDKKALQFSLEVASSLLTHLERYTGQPMGLTKLEHAAIPRFGNAMENWGLVSYDEQFLVLAGKKVHRLRRIQAVLTIGHETSHQQFGNLVGPAWWSYLWLSEGFATYFEVVLGNAQYPELIPLEETFAMRHMRPALHADALPISHALTVEPLPADTVQIEELFDTLTYSKAGCILRMINCTIGESAFQAGVRRYLETHRNAVVRPTDLYNSFTNSTSGWPSVEQMFRSWTDKPGYPVVTVERLSAQYVRLRQKRYQLQEETPDHISRWHIPITYYTNSSRGRYEYRPAFWMRETDREMVVKLEMTGSDVLIVNPRQVGFYRVEYDEKGWQRIVDSVRTFPPTTQVKLIDDAFVLAKVGLGEYNACIRLLQQLPGVRDPLPWLTAMAEENVGFLQRNLRSVRFDRIVRGLAGEMFQFFSNGSTVFDSEALDRAYDWWKRLGGTTISGRRKFGPGFDTGCPVRVTPLTVRELVLEFSSLDESVELRVFARIKCQRNARDALFLTVLNRISKNKLLPIDELYKLLEKLINTDATRFLGMVLQFLSNTTSHDGGAQDPMAIAELQRLLNHIVTEVNNREQIALVRKLIARNESLLPGGFLQHANTIMTSTISWRTANAQELNQLIAHFANYRP